MLSDEKCPLADAFFSNEHTVVSSSFEGDGSSGDASGKKKNMNLENAF